MEKLFTIELKVELILAGIPSTRNNDKKLICVYLDRFHNIKTFDDYSTNPDAPSLESIRRCRQKIQAKGFYLANDETKAFRSSKRKEYKDYALGGL